MESLHTLVEVAEQRNVTRFASLQGTAIALGNLSTAEFDGIYDNLTERYATTHNPSKKAQLWQDMSAMEQHLWDVRSAA